MCQGFCAGLYRCGLADHGCTEGCIAEYQPLGFRGSALAAVGACAKLADCETLASDDPTKACFEQAGRAEPLRAELLDYCESASRAYFRCDNWWSIEDCTESMGVFEDDVLARAQMSCHGRDCDALADCETSIFNPEASDQ